MGNGYILLGLLLFWRLFDINLFSSVRWCHVI